MATLLMARGVIDTFRSRIIEALNHSSLPHTKWVEFIETFPYVIKYEQGKEHIVADALSFKYVLLSTLNARFLGFEHIKELYKDDSDFANACETSALEKFYRLDEYLFKESHSFVPLSYMRELVVHEAHGGELMGSFGVVRLQKCCMSIFIGLK